MTIPGLDAWITGDYGQRDRRGRPIWWDEVDEDEEQEEDNEMQTCFYCGEPAVYFEDDTGYCKRCWDETEVNIAKHRREEATKAVIKAAREVAKHYVVGNSRFSVSVTASDHEALRNALAALDEAAK